MGFLFDHPTAHGMPPNCWFRRPERSRARLQCRADSQRFPRSSPRKARRQEVQGSRWEFGVRSWTCPLRASAATIEQRTNGPRHRASASAVLSVRATSSAASWATDGVLDVEGARTTQQSDPAEFNGDQARELHRGMMTARQARDRVRCQDVAWPEADRRRLAYTEFRAPGPPPSTRSATFAPPGTKRLPSPAGEQRVTLRVLAWRGSR